MYFATNNQNGLDTPNFDTINELQDWLFDNDEVEQEWDCFELETLEKTVFECAYHTGYIPSGAYEGLEEWHCETEVNWPGQMCEEHAD